MILDIKEVPHYGYGPFYVCEECAYFDNVDEYFSEDKSLCISCKFQLNEESL